MPSSCCAAIGAALVAAAASEPEEIHFERVELAREFLCEGATFADLDRDGHQDVVAGPYWYAGPEYRERHAIYEPVPFDPHAYSDHFFAWPRDLDGDGWTDLLVVGFPGKEAHWYRNPLGRRAESARDGGPGSARARAADERWERFLVRPHVDNESPAFTDLTGDGEPELVFHTGGRFGWAEPDAEDPRAPWTFHAISEDVGVGPFTHGLGVGDVDGDGRADVLWRGGWFRQPASLAGDPPWEHRAVTFSDQEGGAQMFAHDVDGDGLQDVVTSLAAHHFGLAWFRQRRGPGGIEFVEHRILGTTPEAGLGGLQVAELHALDLADVDGDGDPDVVTGKRWWSHGPQGDPHPGSKPVVVWLELRRGGKDGRAVEWIPHVADEASGVGTQLVTGDVDGDGRRDVVVANKRGAFLLLQRPGPAPAADAAVPPAAEDPPAPPEDPGQKPKSHANLDLEKGDLSGWTATGDAFADQPVRGDAVSARGREPSGHAGERWIGGYELHGDARRGTLVSDAFRVEAPWASFLVGGGNQTSTRVEIVAEDGAVLFQTTGANYETLQRVAVDLRGREGRKIRVRLVDEATGGWGHVNFDDFRFHAARPELARPPGVPAILPIDPVAHAGLSPEAALAAMEVPDGFRVELVAAEPDVRQPIALAIDDKGRLWIAQAFTYPARAPGDEGRDEIVVLEDRNADGAFETRTVFLGGLNLVSGLEVGFGGVWIGAAPYLLFVPDADGDLVPDGPARTLLDGWAFDDTHETLNAFTWGPDGWLYGCHGVFTHSRVGPPGTPDEQRTPIDAGVWRYHPKRHEFEVFAWGTSNPWGIDFDERGQAVITACVIPHLWHVIQGARYERQAGEHFDRHLCGQLSTIADHRHYVGDVPHAGNLRSNERGGGHAHCGAMVYLGGAFPEPWGGAVFMGNIHGNRVNVDRLERSGSGLVGRHAADFLLANDRWFRAINLKYDHTGSVYLIDWYDEQACHDTRDDAWDRSNGRLYRVAWRRHLPRRVDLANMPGSALADLVGHENAWFARHARRILQERAPDAGVQCALRGVLEGRAGETKRLRALWALHAVGGTSERLLRRLLADELEFVRAWAVQLLLEDRAVEPETLAALEARARDDASPVVRLYLASALQRLPLAERWTIAEALLARAEDAQDANLPKMVGYGVEPLVAADPPRALALATRARVDLVARFLVRRAAADPDLHAELVRALARPESAEHLPWMLAAAAEGLRDQRGLAEPAGWSELHAHLAEHADARVREHAAEIARAFGDRASFAALRGTLAEAGAPVEERTRALEALVQVRDPETEAILLQLLDDESLRGPAIRALAAYAAPRVSGAVLVRWPRLDADERRAAVDTLSSRSTWAADLLAAVDAGAVERSELGAFTVRKLESLGDPAIVERVRAVWGSLRATDAERRAEIERWKLALGPEALAEADLPRGRDVFSRTCQQCHTLFGEGGAVGPDLSGSNRADLEYLLSNVLDPNAVVARDYLATLVWTTDGRLITGIRRGETDSSITLATEDATLVVAREDIEESRLSDLSTMPEGLLAPLAPDEVRDLVAYLASPVQTPLAATRWNRDRFFDGRSLRGWSGDPELWSVEDGEIVGRTAGLARNAFLVSDLELADFRLELQVRLAGDAGNSGVQFRSRALPEGEVAGYQADVGPGWWGKLYEEHGRGLLWERSGEEHVRRDGWNDYVIEARGPRVRTWINGAPCVDLVDEAGARRGVVAFQLHSGGATEVRFRKFRLELSP